MTTTTRTIADRTAIAHTHVTRLVDRHGRGEWNDTLDRQDRETIYGILPWSVEQCDRWIHAETAAVLADLHVRGSR